MAANAAGAVQPHRQCDILQHIALARSRKARALHAVRAWSLDAAAECARLGNQMENQPSPSAARFSEYERPIHTAQSR